MRQAGLFGLSEHLERLSKDGDPLEVLEAAVDFEYFRPWLVAGLGYGDGAKGGRPPFDPVSMFKALILQAQHNLSDARMEFMIRDRLSWMRFLGFDLGAPTPDENTIRHFRNRLSETGTLKRVMKAFDGQLRKKGYIPMAGQIVDASLVPAPKQRNTQDEKAAIKAGKSAGEIWPDAPNKAAQKDVDARWTLKIGGKLRYRSDGTPLPMIATPVFGYKSHIRIDRRFGFIRQAAATSAAAPDGKHLQAPCQPGEHRLGSLGRQRLPVESQRDLAGAAHAEQPHSSAQAGRQADAGANGQSQCTQVIGARRRRARLWPPEEPVRSVHPHDRAGAS